MADFWDSATRGFNTGVVLGERGAERAADREEREKWRAEQKERNDRLDAMTQEAHTARMEEHKEKKEYEKLGKQVQAMSIMLDAGDEPGFLAQAQRVHGTMWPDGQEGRFYVRKDLPDDHPLAKKWDNDPILKSNPIAYVSEGDGGKGAVTPFKSTKDILKLMTDVTEKPDAYFAARKQLKEKISTLNASQEPFMGDDGKRYINEFIEGRAGNWRKRLFPTPESPENRNCRKKLGKPKRRSEAFARTTSVSWRDLTRKTRSPCGEPMPRKPVPKRQRKLVAKEESRRSKRPGSNETYSKRI